MKEHLKNLCVLVTRPKPQGEVLCELIKQRGGEAIYFPTIEIVPLEPAPLASLDTADWVIFVSPKAVLYGAKLLPSGVKIAAVGPGTAKVLQEKYFLTALYPDDHFSSEGLLALPEFQQIKGKRVFIFRGEGGRETLADTLESRGADVTPVIVYKRTLSPIEVTPFLHLLKEHKIDIIVCTSGEGLRNLLQLFGKDNQPPLLSIPLLVVSERLGELAKNLGFDRVILSKNAQNETILEVLSKERKTV